ncbi:MAG: LbtU family siderophore porin [Proteobacteria bacterium]|nr:LbtU family siderophore porin [Desulfobacteraceae bacterium]MBU3981835.1 LbtU family siderophore porin [Pseudomonadota bacterium]MBU4012335.1 LbtU family siderophore porin [Pseudomonadota bacterium]MBU4068796.1 LbtU family siderophore porin [Pseudomonadota bacterium]MBU4100868.1 LbtU family siderophore porin [Pseudomonadota bacterium]
MYKQNLIIIGITLFFALFIINSNAFAISKETEQLLKLLEKKNIITDQEAADIRQEMEPSSQAGDKEAHETKFAGLLGKWADKIHPSACIEVEAFYQDYDFHDPSVRDTDTSDLKLATVAFGFDVDIAKHVKGSLFFLYEEDDTDPIEIDEGIITIDGADVVPLYVDLGKMYVPFGRFESHFISDPLTLELGETNESAVVVGSRNDWVELSVGAFNGDIDETGDENHIDNYLASAIFTLPETTVPDFNLTAGISVISNIADSNNLQTVGTGVSAATIKNHIGGFNTFIIASLLDRFFFNAEYLGAIDDFEAGELSFDGGKAYRPEAWAIELACGVTDNLNLAVCYEGSNDCGDFLPEKQFGGVVSYGLFKDTSIALEYLYGKYENKDTRHLMTTMLAIEF